MGGAGVTDNPKPSPAAMDAARKVLDEYAYFAGDRRTAIARAMDAFAASQVVAERVWIVGALAKEYPAGASCEAATIRGVLAGLIERIRQRSKP